MPDAVLPQPPGLTAEAAKYVPAPERQGVALCLSGGGFRAALFHLGALRRLNELGVLARLDTVTSVSGGSIIAAHLADQLHKPAADKSPLADWDKTVADPFRRFTAQNLRTAPLLKRYLLPWNWFRPASAVEALAAGYEKRLTALTLADLPSRPDFIFCATDLVFGDNWIFTRNKVGDYRAGYAMPPPPWPVARAVAASSCFPPVFDPLSVGLPADRLTGGRYSGPDRAAFIAGLHLSDGGVYDNLGLEPVWKSHAVLLVSDGGEPFAFGAAANPFQQLARYLDIILDQGGAVRKRWLIANFIARTMAGTYWGIGSATSSYGAGSPAGYSKALATEVIGRIRTDLDAFSPAEIAVLENHGYLLADAALRRHVPDFYGPSAPPPQVPHPTWMDEDRVRAALRNSDRRTLLGRFRAAGD